LSPRSEEYLEQAHDRLRSARALLDIGQLRDAASRAYYAMFDAARAALSEEDLYAKTHRGTWHLFHETFVAPGRFDAQLHTRAAEGQEMREAADYGAGGFDEDAHGLTADAERFVAAIEAMLAR